MERQVSRRPIPGSVAHTTEPVTRPVPRWQASLLALQRQAGNRAVASLLTDDNPAVRGIVAAPMGHRELLPVQRYQPKQAVDPLNRVSSVLRRTPEEAVSGTVKGWILVAAPSQEVVQGWERLDADQLPQEIRDNLGNDQAWVLDGTSTGLGSLDPSKHAEQQLLAAARNAGVTISGRPDAAGLRRILALYTERQPCTAAGNNSCEAVLQGSLNANTLVFYTFGYDDEGLGAMHEYQRWLFVENVKSKLKSTTVYDPQGAQVELDDRTINEIASFLNDATVAWDLKPMHEWPQRGREFVKERIRDHLRESTTGQPSTSRPVIPPSPSPSHSPERAASPPAAIPLVEDEERNTTTRSPGPSAAPQRRSVKDIRESFSSLKTTQHVWFCSHCGQRSDKEVLSTHFRSSPLQFERGGAPVRDKVKCKGSNQRGGKHPPS